MRATRSPSARGWELPDLPACDFLHRHREVVLRAGLDQRGRSFLEAHALAELVVIVVDLAGALGCHEDERITRAADLIEQVVETWVDHRRETVPVAQPEDPPMRIVGRAKAPPKGARFAGAVPRSSES